MRSERYVVPRLPLAYLSIGGYLKTFWWFAAAIPSFGLLCIIFGDPSLKLIGFLAIFWPFTLPARAILSSSKSSRLFSRGVWVEYRDDTFWFHGDSGNGMKLDITSVRASYDVTHYLVLQTRMGGIVPIAKSALGEELELWRMTIRDGIASWREAEPGSRSSP